MKIDLSQFRQTFLQESAEHVAFMETALLDLRQSPADLELMNAIFRSAHSIKGGAGSFGLQNLVRFTHALENLLDKLRSLELTVTEQAIGLMLKSVDVLRALLDAGEGASMPDGVPQLLEQIEALSSGQPPAQQAVAPPPAIKIDSASSAACYLIEFLPVQELFSSGTNPLILLRNLASLGSVRRCTLNVANLPPLAELDPALSYLSWAMELETEADEGELREVFEFVEHLAEVRITRVADQPAQGGLRITTSGAAALLPSAPEPLTALARPETSSPPVAAGKSASSTDIEVASVRAPIAAPSTASRKSGASGDAGSIRVSTDKVDRLIDLVGELVIAHAMTQQMVESIVPESLPRLRDAVASMERNMRELHERVMGIRMMPIGSLFGRYTRTVYDIAQATTKKIELQTSGEETEIDKSMLELLGDPLTHLIRNAADHGIETPAQRVAAGKAEQGTITLSACHRSGRLAIDISDDGAGIDPQRVRAKAIERGLITAEAQLTDEQLSMLIFEPGFSTRDEVTDLSGRGVGMDVVKRNIQQLSGVVTMNSRKGFGSTVSIELPLTLAILEGLLVRVADRTLVLPLLAVIETVAPSAGQVQRIAEQGEVVVIRGESIPLLRLSRFLGLASTPAVSVGDSKAGNRSLVVIVESGARKVGLVVDELLGQQQVVVKSLEKHLHRVGGLMGATILGDGCVAPIVDIAGVTEMNLFSLCPNTNMIAQTSLNRAIASPLVH